MSEEKKSLSRRSFLKGAATAGVVAAVSGGGLFVQKLEAQRGGSFLRRAGVKEPPGVKEDKDLIPLAENMFRTSLEGAYDAFNAAMEEFVKGKSNKANVNSLLARQGLKLRSAEAKAAGRSFDAPPSVLKIRKAQLKQKGWHAHGRVCFCGCCAHLHVTW